MENLTEQVQKYITRYTSECLTLGEAVTVEDFAGWLFFTLEEESDEPAE